jgi:hypothetical protein
MKARLDFRKASPQGEKAMTGLHMFVRNCGLDHSLLELVKLPRRATDVLIASTAHERIARRW